MNIFCKDSYKRTPLHLNHSVVLSVGMLLVLQQNANIFEKPCFHFPLTNLGQCRLIYRVKIHMRLKITKIALYIAVYFQKVHFQLSLLCVTQYQVRNGNEILHKLDSMMGGYDGVCNQSSFHVNKNPISQKLHSNHKHESLLVNKNIQQNSLR